MDLKRRIRTLEDRTREAAEQESRFEDFPFHWPGKEPRIIKVPRGMLERIVKLYGEVEQR